MKQAYSYCHCQTHWSQIKTNKQQVQTINGITNKQHYLVILL